MGMSDDDDDAEVPGLPLLGNLLQLKEKKPYKAFTYWAEIYGPVYSIQLGSSHAIVLSNAEVAKEAMVARFPAISTRKLSNALTILTYDKCMVATSDYNDFHKTVKKIILNCLLGANAQKRIRSIRESMLENVVDRFNTHVKSTPLEAVNFREIFESELFGLSLKQATGRDLQSLYVEDLGATLSRREIFQILVLDMMQGAIEVDWRDFSPYLKWVPGYQVEANMRKLDIRRKAVMKSLLREHKKRVEEGKIFFYISFLPECGRVLISFLLNTFLGSLLASSLQKCCKPENFVPQSLSVGLSETIYLLAGLQLPT